MGAIITVHVISKKNHVYPMFITVRLNGHLVFFLLVIERLVGMTGEIVPWFVFHER